MGAADSGSWDTSDLGADGKSQRPGIPEIPGMCGDPQPRPSARARTHTHTHTHTRVTASLPTAPGLPRGVRDALTPAHARSRTSGQWEKGGVDPVARSLTNLDTPADRGAHWLVSEG